MRRVRPGRRVAPMLSSVRRNAAPMRPEQSRSRSPAPALRAPRVAAAGVAVLLLALGALHPAARAGDLDVVNELAARARARVVAVREHAALLDASGPDADAPRVRADLDGVALTTSLDVPDAPFTVGVRSRDQRLVLFRVSGGAVHWTATTLASELRLLPGFHAGEGPFPPDFDATDSTYNRRRYGGAPVVDERDYALRCTSAPDSNGSTLRCSNGYGREVLVSRCYRALDGSVTCERRGE